MAQDQYWLYLFSGEKLLMMCFETLLILDNSVWHKLFVVMCQEGDDNASHIHAS